MTSFGILLDHHVVTKHRRWPPPTNRVSLTRGCSQCMLRLSPTDRRRLELLTFGRRKSQEASPRLNSAPACPPVRLSACPPVRLSACSAILPQTHSFNQAHPMQCSVSSSGMNYPDLTQTLVDSFNALADEVQCLSDRKTILEHKLRFAHEQVRLDASFINPSINPSIHQSINLVCFLSLLLSSPSPSPSPSHHLPNDEIL